MEGVGQPVLSSEQRFVLFCSFPLLFAFVVGGLGFEFCVFVAGWRHALRSEWPFIIIGIGSGVQSGIGGIERDFTAFIKPGGFLGRSQTKT